jgi:hypothetical protein
MALRIKKAQRMKVKLKMGIEGPSGSGKTYSALMIAKGLVPGGRVLVIDTENASASLYSHLYEYFTIEIAPPFRPEKFVEAIGMGVSEAFDVIIIDSASHEWNGKGGCLEIHDSMPGNPWTNWAKVNPRHQAFVDAMLQSSVHVIACLRSKEKYAQEEEGGKQKVKKLGAEAVQRDGLNYEFSTVLTMDISHQAMSTKDRTGLFNDQWFTPTEETGRRIAEYLDSGADAPVIAPAPDSPRPQPQGNPIAEAAKEIYKRYLSLFDGNSGHAVNAMKKAAGKEATRDFTMDDIEALRLDLEFRENGTSDAAEPEGADGCFDAGEMPETVSQ